MVCSCWQPSLSSIASVIKHVEFEVNRVILCGHPTTDSTETFLQLDYSSILSAVMVTVLFRALSDNNYTS